MYTTITPDLVSKRIKEINHETPAIWTTSLIKSPQELTVRTTARNNLMLEQVLENQLQILANQNMIIQNIQSNNQAVIGRNMQPQQIAQA